jgi:signal transduction histidine kinase
MESNLTFFPFPYISKNQIFDGSLISIPVQCKKCGQSCVNSKNELILSICSYGYNYLRLTKDTVICGFIIREYPQLSLARKKNLKTQTELLVSRQQYENAIQSLKRDFETRQTQIQEEKDIIIRDYIKKEQFKPDFLEPLKKDISMGLSFVHDYKQINTQILQNINVILETTYSGIDIEEKLDKSTSEEKAIYMAAKLLDEKLMVARLLVNPYLINRKSDFKKFRFHGLLMKYRRIYTPYIKSKKIDVQVVGQSHHDIIAHPEATAVIPHTLIDNAIKYSPQNGKVEITVQDLPNEILFSVSSFGPKILVEEKEKIFQPFYRGKLAMKEVEEGAGYGLYVSQQVAINHFGVKIEFNQDLKQTLNSCYWITFSIKLPLKSRD